MENFCKNGKLEKKDGYEVCRDVNRRDLPDGGLRYDLTKIHPKKGEGELPRTFGHYHTVGFTELFEVIKGNTVIIMQKEGGSPDIIEKVYRINGKEKDKIIVMQNFGFTNINPDSENELILSNWISKSVENIYEDIKNLGGFCYVAKRDAEGKIFFEKNKNYTQVPELIELKPKKLPRELENLDFLIHPEKYKEILTIENLYDHA